MTAMSEHLLHTSSKFHELATALSALIDGVSGGYPLVSVLVGRNGGVPLYLWQYAKHDFHLYIDRNLNGHFLIERTNLPCEIILPSEEDALELVRLTESIRQKSDWPIVRLGALPTTDLSIQTRPAYAQSEMDWVPCSIGSPTLDPGAI
jgi:hypothetical protein